jgi:pyruvate kinase
VGAPSIPGGAPSPEPVANLRSMSGAARRRTKIVATIGPASGEPDRLRSLVEEGMDGARLNFSHGAHSHHAERVDAIRAVQEEIGRPLALIADLQGPKLRVGHLDEPVQLRPGDDIDLVGGESAPNGALPVSPAVIGDVLRPGHDVLIDDGLIRLKVAEVAGGRARCEILVGGQVLSHKGVNLPGVPVPIPSLTQKDVSDLELALSLEVDFVALSFVRSPADVRDLRRLIEEAGSNARVIAKIEKSEAVDALDAVLAEADGVMVARGDLGVEIGPAAVPLLQKRIILKALERGKPVITATQMLESMIHNAEPTRAEASDVANAILDGTSAVMLSGETAIGEYPVEAVRTMATIATEVEPSLGYRHQLPDASDEPSVGNAMSNAACDLAETLGASAILVPTFSGRTASAVARLRPRRPVVGLSHHQYALQQMALEWGVTPLDIPECADVEELWSRSLGAAKDAGVVQSGDRVVITAGTAVNIPGSTNVIKVDVA